ncbi:hypothetical protein VP01_8974g1, partial [Puccinia sorghi]
MAALGVDLFSRNSGDPNHTNTNQSREQDPIEEFELYQKINCLTKFKIFYSKQKYKKTIWASISSPKAFQIVFHSWSTSYDQFQELVARHCNNQFPSAGPLIRETARLGKDVVSCGLKLSNENPSQIEKQEAAAAEVWNHLISIEASRNASTSRRRNQEDLNDPTLDFEDTTNLYMEKLYQALQPNLNYEKDFPIFIDPKDPNRHIPLMLATVQAWAKAL